MLGHKPPFVQNKPPAQRNPDAAFPRFAPRPLEISEQSLTEFLKAPRRTRLTEAHDCAFFAPFEITGRSKQLLIFSEWFEGISPFKAIDTVQRQAPAVDLLQLSLVRGQQPVVADSCQKTLSRDKNGRYGLELILNGANRRVSPLQTIATNRPLDLWFSNFLEENSLSAKNFFALGGKLNLLECRQFILVCGRHAKAVETYRGAHLVLPDAPADALADNVIAGMARWFMANREPDGALPYKYWPSSGKYSTTDNTIRRFMASVAFNRLAAALRRHDVKEAARRNLDYNMRRFYRLKDGKGMIAWDGSVKLGALAVAGLAIIESPFAETWNDELTRLRATIDELWTPSGAFRTFFHPKERNDNQNFYPGEALLFWATSLEMQPDGGLMDRALKSVDYYRSHFRRNPNPAFVPWHSQAMATLFRLTGDTALRDFVFEMNDWLLPHQQWGGNLDHDHWGRFYSPERRDYGPPHASSTGVFMEGLVDAMTLAREAGETARAASYEEAIKRGIRSIAQLQYKDDLDAFYVSKRERVIGAIRTEADDNEIRIDNLQHALMALLRYRAAEAGGSSQGEARPPMNSLPRNFAA